MTATGTVVTGALRLTGVFAAIATGPSASPAPRFMTFRVLNGAVCGGSITPGVVAVTSSGKPVTTPAAKFAPTLANAVAQAPGITSDAVELMKLYASPGSTKAGPVRLMLVGIGPSMFSPTVWLGFRTQSNDSVDLYVTVGPGVAPAGVADRAPISAAANRTSGAHPRSSLRCTAMTPPHRFSRTLLRCPPRHAAGLLRRPERWARVQYHTVWCCFWSGSRRAGTSVGCELVGSAGGGLPGRNRSRQHAV